MFGAEQKFGAEKFSAPALKIFWRGNMSAPKMFLPKQILSAPKKFSAVTLTRLVDKVVAVVTKDNEAKMFFGAEK